MNKIAFLLKKIVISVKKIFIDFFFVFCKNF
jgi:hypothetical protein